MSTSLTTKYLEARGGKGGGEADRARLAQEDGVVFASPGQDLCDPDDLLVTPHHLASHQHSAQEKDTAARLCRSRPLPHGKQQGPHIPGCPQQWGEDGTYRIQPTLPGFSTQVPAVIVQSFLGALAS
jgi:hypothetical protein